jgi:predicted lipoprotein
MTPIGVRLGFAAAAFCASATFAHAEVDHQKMARATLEQYIRPGYAELAGSAAALNLSVRKLCRHPSTETLEFAKHVFAATVAAWSAVEPIRFGRLSRKIIVMSASFFGPIRRAWEHGNCAGFLKISTRA